MRDRSKQLPRLIPTGTCWCGCGKDTAIGSYFVRGHDKIAEAALMALEYGSSVPQLLHRHGFGPQRSVTDAAVHASDCPWVRCQHCGYAGAPESVRRHEAKHEQR
ncbi:hypothetical protein [Streptomyces sp. NPDC005209]|uniref:hypothetical protein n=1 Tax=Streptomyces sp. NPDC005209 TaxID=3156715 RepID=UPI0033A1A607